MENLLKGVTGKKIIIVNSITLIFSTHFMSLKSKLFFSLAKYMFIFMGILLIFLTSCITRQHKKLHPKISEFIYNDNRIPSCHASTLVELENGDILAAWFGGKHEGDKSVEIWMARRNNNKWLPPVAMTDYPDIPVWNPVLFRDNTNKIWLFFKVGPSPTNWTGAYRTSLDNGRTWGEVVFLPAGLLGPVKNKPIQLINGDIVCGTSTEAYHAWTSWVNVSSDGGITWRVGGPIVVPNQPFGVIQPTLWEYEPGKLKMLMRSHNIGYIIESRSEDGGYTWSPGTPVKKLPHPNSGIDAVLMTNGSIALVYNHTQKGRSPLNIAFSRDNGITWSDPYVLEEQKGEYSYPAIIQGKDGRLHITYTWKRKKIKYLVVEGGEANK